MRDRDLEEKYNLFKRSIELQLSDGKSWIQTDHKLVVELADRIEQNKKFFIEKVRHDFFVVEYILVESKLYRDHVIEFDGWSEHRNLRQQHWIEILTHK